MVVGRPVPDTETLGAVRDCRFHVEVLKVLLLVGDDDVDVAFGSQAVVHGAEETVAIRGKVDADDFRGFVGKDVEETGVLVGEAGKTRLAVMVERMLFECCPLIRTHCDLDAILCS